MDGTGSFVGGGFEGLGSKASSQNNSNRCNNSKCRSKVNRFQGQAEGGIQDSSHHVLDEPLTQRKLHEDSSARIELSRRRTGIGFNHFRRKISAQTLQEVLSSASRTSSWWSHFQQLLWPAPCLICRRYLGDDHCRELVRGHAGSDRPGEICPGEICPGEICPGEICPDGAHSGETHPRENHGCVKRSGQRLTRGASVGAGAGDSRRSLICELCLRQMPGLDDMQCFRCGASVGPVAVESDHRSSSPCQRCRTETWRPDLVMRLLVYRGLARRACLSCKTAAGEQLTAELSRLLVAKYSKLLCERRPDLIVPVPAYWLRRFWGHDHPSEVMARTISRLTGSRMAAGLILRVRKGRRQKRLSAQERRVNVEGQYRVIRSRGLTNANVLLVDDVVTSGATVNEIALLLRRKGARRIDVVTLARGLPASPTWKSARKNADFSAQTLNASTASS